MKRGFTLVELLVVVAMIAVLGGALTTSISQSRKRAQIAKATQDAKEITNAILAYQNYAPNRSLENEAKNSWMPATKANLAMILGGGKTAEGGGQIPVLYNAQIKGDEVRDPWGRPYEFMIRKVTEQDDGGQKLNYVTAPSLPNFYRLTDEERQ